ncbi:hypothetical protein U1Q18_049662 [Sarracenia purpurea var. burkii]
MISDFEPIYLLNLFVHYILNPVKQLRYVSRLQAWFSLPSQLELSANFELHVFLKDFWTFLQREILLVIEMIVYNFYTMEWGSFKLFSEVVYGDFAV